MFDESLGSHVFLKVEITGTGVKGVEVPGGI